MTNPQSSILGGDERVRGGSPRATGSGKEGQRSSGSFTREGGRGFSYAQGGCAASHERRNPARTDSKSCGRASQRLVSDHKAQLDHLQRVKCGASVSRATRVVAINFKKNPDTTSNRQTVRGTGATRPERTHFMLPEHVSRDQYTHSPVSVDPDAGVAA